MKRVFLKRLLFALAIPLIPPSQIWAGDAGDVEKFVIYKSGKPVLQIMDRAGPLTSMALPPPDVEQVYHPFITASALDPMEEGQLRKILDASESTAQFLDNLRKAGYQVQRKE